MSQLFQEIYHTLCSGKELVIATIISSKGSTPRISGANMLVYSDGSISGTIGGGIVEGDVIRTALGLFESRDAVIATYYFNRNCHNDMDLVCGGEMQVLMEHVSAEKGNREMFGLMCEEISRARPFFWIGKASENGRKWQVKRAVQTTDNRWLGSLQMDLDLQKKLNGFNLDRDKTAMIKVDNDQYVVSAVLPPDIVYLIGAGHVAREIARLTKQVGFRTLVFDDRAEFANTERFPDADGVFVCKDFTSVLDGYSITPGCSIVIVTRGHRFDKEVLARTLRTEAGYIGMIGSRKKRQSVYQELINEGFEQGDIDRVHCPIGLSINAETPAEIGVSIVAELIHHRAHRRSHG